MYLIRADTEGKEPVQEAVRFSDMASSAFFSPNGNNIVFCGNFNGALDLYQVSLAGGKPTPVIAGRTGTGFCLPIVTSDGKSIYCMERYTPDLYKMNTNGSGLRQIADSSLFSDPMNWKPETK